MRRPLLIFACVLLAGCAVGRDDRPPTALGDTPPERFAAAGAATAEAPLPDDWWRLYRDPALDRLIAVAFAANTDLRVAAANLEVARAALDQTRARFLPTTTVAAGAQYGISTPALTAADVGRRTPEPDAILTAAVGASWEIDLFGRIRRATEAARADLAAVAGARDGVRVSVAAETVRAYADACAFAAASDVQRRSIAVADRGLVIVRAQAAAGAAADFEVTRGFALAEQARAALPQLEAGRANALYRLAVLTGQPPETRIDAAERCRSPLLLANPVPVGDGRALLERRPDVRQAERALAAATARIGVATADLYPTISLGASGSSIAATVPGLGAAAGRTWSLGPLLSWSFPNLVAARARVRGAQASTQAALASFDGAVLAALRDVEQALATEAAELDRRDALARARARDARAVVIAEDRYKAGATGFLDLLDAQRTLIADDNALALSAQALASDQVLVFKALGGGWRQATPGG